MSTKTRVLVAGSVAKVGGLLVMLITDTPIVACEVVNGKAEPVGTLDSDDHFAEIISHDRVNLGLNVAQITTESVVEIGGKQWRVRDTYDANASPVRIPLELVEEVAEAPAAPIPPAAPPEPQHEPVADGAGELQHISAEDSPATAASDTTDTLGPQDAPGADDDGLAS